MKKQSDWEKRFDEKWMNTYMSEKSFKDFRQFLKRLIASEIKKAKEEVLEYIDTFLSFNRDLGTKPQTATIIAKEWDTLKTSLKGEK